MTPTPADLAALLRMVRFHALFDGTPRGEPAVEPHLDALVRLGFAVKHDRWCDITPAGRVEAARHERAGAAATPEGTKR